MLQNSVPSIIHEQRGEAELHLADLHAEQGERDRQENKADGQRHTVRVGVELCFQLREHKARKRAEEQRAGNFNERIDQDRHKTHNAGGQRLGNAERNGEHDQTHGIVQRNDRQQQVGQLALRLVLAHDHQRCRRRSRRGDRAERDRRRHGENVGAQQVEADERGIDQNRRNERLYHADDKRLTSGLFQLRETKLVSDGKGDKAHGNIGHDPQLFHFLITAEAETGNADPSQHERTDQNARDQKRRHIGQMPAGEQPRHQKTGKQCKGEIQKRVHNKNYLLPKLWRRDRPKTAL